MIFQDESSDMDTEPSHSCDAELDDEIIGKALSSPLFIQEREEPANLRQAYHSHEESLLPAQSKWKTKESGFSLLDKKSKVRTEIQMHEFQADSDRSIQELIGIVDSQRREIDYTMASDEQSRRDQLLLQEQLSEQNRDLRDAQNKSLHEMEE